MKHELTNLRTRQMFAASLRRQLEKKALSKITVSEIAADCSVNRKTFYYHFEDIYALFKWMLEQETVEVVKKFDLLIDHQEAIEFIMDYVTKNKHILNSAYDAVGREGLKRFFYADFIGIIENYIDNLAEKQGVEVDADYKHFLSEFFTEAVAGTILSWCTGTQSSIKDRDKTLLYLENILCSILPEMLRLKEFDALP